MSKVLVDRELLERVTALLEWDGMDDTTPLEFGAKCDSLCKELADYIAQPAEAEGVAVVGYAVTWIRVGETPEKTVFMSAADFEATGGPRFYSYCEPLIPQSTHLAALSAVTAERDRLRDDAERLEFIEKHWFYEEESGRWAFMYGEDWNKQGLTFRDAIDAARASMAAKEA